MFLNLRVVGSCSHMIWMRMDHACIGMWKFGKLSKIWGQSKETDRARRNKWWTHEWNFCFAGDSKHLNTNQGTLERDICTWKGYIWVGLGSIQTSTIKNSPERDLCGVDPSQVEGDEEIRARLHFHLAHLGGDFCETGSLNKTWGEISVKLNLYRKEMNHSSKAFGHFSFQRSRQGERVRVNSNSALSSELRVYPQCDTGNNSQTRWESENEQ